MSDRCNTRKSATQFENKPYDCNPGRGSESRMPPPITPITSPQMPHIAYLVVQQNISSCCRADISRSLGFQALPTSFGVVRSAPKRSLADSSDESVPTEIHRSFRREPVVVHARRSPSNGRRGAAGSWLVSEPAGQVGGRARRHSLWTSQPSTTSTNAMIPVG